VVVRSGGVGRWVVVGAFVVVVVGGASVVVVVVLVVVVLLVVLLATELLPVGLVCLLVVVVVVSCWRVGSVTGGVVVSTIWKVTNLVGTEVVSMRCSTIGAVVSTGLAEVVRRRGGLMVGAKVVVGTTLGFRVVRTTKCEFLWVV